MAKAADEVGPVRIRVVTPSHKRWDRVQVNKALDGAILCVPESQAAAYRDHNPDNEILPHPDAVRGLPMKLQWTFEKMGGQFMSVDDDIDALQRLYLGPGDFRTTRIEKEKVRTLIDHTAYVAKQMGAFFFGFAATMDGRDYTGVRPFRLKGYCLGAGMGFLAGSRISWSDRITGGSDYWASLVNAYYHRYAFFDLRFGWRTVKTFKNQGGMSEYRTFESERKDYETLRRVFGDAVAPKHKPRPHKHSHPYEKMLSIPW